MLVTPSPADTGAGVEQQQAAKADGGSAGGKRVKNLVELLSTSYDGFKYSDWAAEFNLTVNKMLS